MTTNAPHWVFAIPLTAVIGVAFAAGIAWQSGSQNAADIRDLVIAGRELQKAVTDLAIGQAADATRLDGIVKALGESPVRSFLR